MSRLSLLLGCAFLGLAVLAGSVESQDKKDTPKAKGMLPPGWKELDLSKEQILGIYKVQNSFKAKAKMIEDQLKELRGQECAEMVKLLTTEQKDLLRKLAVGEGVEPKKKDDKKSKDPDKTGN